ncbi:hypothetical protein A2763_00705 [Candidatus Kaiserbacteria bacterium RIFCSPHIGHO2_01_FULL_54_36]|uniref:Uncharacterized protein n=1 Tax=Candidatus Kaiserbacteria bacterium RIFCSPHIGHO2_01_FULL_54_36 TaxID=1798482 RepID=A0A1F6CPQ4_9BACT|nr:MAG: hypothetical protein A2763_00705 [Candidatus Kaiserbacteria bacterium RIFCSPHIGHO2_01_FULL_54_36]OGG75549.1 MAG: hypothetical protein A3A41_02910 [Candidatus Kaiserbacteria bacterium RIFCSPLOWO2_01_FULL_54_22]
MKVLSIVAVVAALAALAVTPAQAQNSTWAAVAISTSPLKDAFGFQYLKTSQAGAENDAIRFCEERFAKYRIRGATCAVKSTTDWVIGVYCLNGGKVGVGIGVGATPVEAANEALKEAGAFQARRCVFQAMRHGTNAKATIEGREWTATVSCGAGTFTFKVNGAVAALNRALRSCENTNVSACNVTAFTGS